jgi:hypothetical protein
MGSYLKEFSILENSTSPKDQPNYENITGYLPRRLALFHTIKNLFSFTNAINNQSPVTTEHLKGIKEEEKAEYLALGMGGLLDEAIQQKGEDFDEFDLLRVLIQSLMPESNKFVLFQFQILLRLAFSVVLLYLFDAVNEGNL